jgi:hypothetical protein
MSGPPTNLPCTIINPQSGLVLHLSDVDDETIVANAPLSPGDLRQGVRVASSSNSIWQWIYSIIVGRSAVK